MTRYNKIWVPAGSPVPQDARGINGFQYIPVKDAVVITEPELLDLMQESIEHSYPILLREKAQASLNAKLNQL